MVELEFEIMSVLIPKLILFLLYYSAFQRLWNYYQIVLKAPPHGPTTRAEPLGVSKHTHSWAIQVAERYASIIERP